MDNLRTLYIYIFEDGDVKQTTESPTLFDEGSIGAGILEVVVVEGVRDGSFAKYYKPIERNNDEQVCKKTGCD